VKNCQLERKTALLMKVVPFAFMKLFRGKNCGFQDSDFQRTFRNPRQPLPLHFYRKSFRYFVKTAVKTIYKTSTRLFSV